jgi:prenyltransferase beta subunit
LVEFEHAPDNLEAFADSLDQELRKRNVYYDDLISGNILDRLKITLVRKQGFIDYMKLIGKLGGQNKVPRLSNDRNLANGLEGFLQSQ